MLYDYNKQSLLLALPGGQKDQGPVGWRPHLRSDVLLEPLQAAVVVGLVGHLVANLRPVLQGLLDHPGGQVQGNLPKKKSHDFPRSKMIGATFQSGGSVHMCGLKISVSAWIRNPHRFGRLDLDPDPGPNNSRFPGPNPLPLAQVNGCCPHQKHYARCRINLRCINSYFKVSN